MTRFAALIAAVLLAAPLSARADLTWDPANPPVSADPVAEAVADNEASCARGAAEVGRGFVRNADVDGDEVNDAILDWGALRCDGSAFYCGSGGCRMDVWLSRPEGGWRLLIRHLANEMHAPVPGALVVRVDAENCVPANSRVCTEVFDTWGGALRLLVPSEEPWQP
jgi:hypothetical protein